MTCERPLHECVYISGPMGWGWEGACEVDDDEQVYRQHYSWPILDSNMAAWVEFSTPLSELLACGAWALVLDPALQVSEGL